MSKKKLVILDLFRQSEKDGFISFSNDLVREASQKVDFKNYFDATKIDKLNLLPDELIERDYFLHHLGNGMHRFIKGYKYAYHDFKPIAHEDCVEEEYKASILNEVNSSESNILSLIFNQRILHSFLYGDKNASLNLYNSHRTKTSFSYRIGEEEVDLNSIQIEIDMTCERNGDITIFEAKSQLVNNFAVYQIFHPFLYYQYLNKKKNLGIKKINCCYVLKKPFKGYTILRMYLYTFDDTNQLTSLRLIKSKEYKLIKSNSDLINEHRL